MAALSVFFLLSPCALRYVLFLESVPSQRSDSHSHSPLFPAAGPRRSLPSGQLVGRSLPDLIVWDCRAICLPVLSERYLVQWPLSLSYGTKISFVTYSCNVHVISASISTLRCTFSCLCRKQPKSFILSFKIFFFKLLNLLFDPQIVVSFSV